MKSPFPGMDPYLEKHWEDVHASLVIDARNALNRKLPADLAASAEERVTVEDEEGEERRRYVPDVKVVGPVGASEGGTAVMAPMRLVVQAEPAKQRYVKVVEVGTGRVITVIEFVNPANKMGAGLREFKGKRAELLEAGVNFVEVDLVQAGDWVALLRPHVCPKEGRSAYRVTVRLPGDPGAVYLYPISMRERLPEIPVPLRAGDPEVKLGLQELVDGAYENGRYGMRLDYAKGAEPELEGEEKAWAGEVVKARGQ